MHKRKGNVVWLELWSEVSRKHLHFCVNRLIMLLRAKNMFLVIFNKWNAIIGHLADEDWQLTPIRAGRKRHTWNVFAVIFSLKWSIFTTVRSCTTRMMVCVCLLWQRLRHWFLPIAFSLFRSGLKYKLCSSMNVCVSCLTSVAWLTTQIFSFQRLCLGKHWPKRNNLRMKAQSFKKSRKTSEK